MSPLVGWVFVGALSPSMGILALFLAVLSIGGVFIPEDTHRRYAERHGRTFDARSVRIRRVCLGLLGSLVFLPLGLWLLLA
jgi:hypothetical protein